MLTLILTLMLMPTLMPAAGTAAARTLVPPTADSSDGDSGGSSTIYVARRSWHVDVGFDAADLLPPLRVVLQDLPGATSLFFGFGDRRYLMSRHRYAATLAALWPGAGLILVTGLRASPAEGFGAVHVIQLRVSREASRRAQQFIWGSLQGVGSRRADSRHADSGHAAQPAAIPGPYDGSVYYGAQPRYSAFHTCNTWAAEVLASAGLPVRSRGVVFANQLWQRVRRMAAANHLGAERVTAE
jgi:hypothetical protein